MARAVRLFVALALAATAAGGCNWLTGKGDAEEVANRAFASRIGKDYDGALRHYDATFFAKTPQAEWVQVLRTVEAKLGDLRTYELANWHVTKNVGTSAPAGSGTYYQLQYRVAYARYPGTETLLLFKPLVGGEIKILGHQINSDGFVK